MSRNTALYLLEHLPESLKYCDPTSFKFSFRRSPTPDQRRLFLFRLRDLALTSISKGKSVGWRINLKECLPNEKQDSELYKSLEKEVTDLFDFIMESDVSYILNYKNDNFKITMRLTGACYHIDDTISLTWNDDFIALLNRYLNEVINAAIQALEVKKQCKTD